LKTRKHGANFLPARCSLTEEIDGFEEISSLPTSGRIVAYLASSPECRLQLAMNRYFGYFGQYNK
jgi:hypothetical protein